MPDRIELAKSLTMKICEDMRELEMNAPTILRFSGKNTEGFGMWVSCTYEQYNEFIQRMNNVYLYPDLKRFTIRTDRYYVDEIWVEVSQDWKTPK